jgi:hypothetical protein
MERTEADQRGGMFLVRLTCEQHCCASSASRNSSAVSDSPEVVTVGAGPDHIAAPLAATADRHLMLGLDEPLSPAAVPTRSPRCATAPQPIPVLGAGTILRAEAAVPSSKRRSNFALHLSSPTATAAHPAVINSGAGDADGFATGSSTCWYISGQASKWGCVAVRYQ